MYIYGSPTLPSRHEGGTCRLRNSREIRRGRRGEELGPYPVDLARAYPPGRGGSCSRLPNPALKKSRQKLPSDLVKPLPNCWESQTASDRGTGSPICRKVQTRVSFISGSSSGAWPGLGCGSAPARWLVQPPPNLPPSPSPTSPPTTGARAPPTISHGLSRASCNSCLHLHAVLAIGPIIQAEVRPEEEDELSEPELRPCGTAP